MATTRVPNPEDLLRQRQAAMQRPAQTPGIRRGEPGPGVLPPPPVAPQAPPPAVPVPPAVNPPAPREPIRIGTPTAPTAPAPAAPAPDLYGREGGGGAGGTLESQIRGALSGMFGGSTSKGFIDRAKSALGTATEAQRAQNVRRIDDDAIRRGLFQSGIPAELSAATGTAAQGSFAAGLADILNQAEQQDIQGRQFATGAATNLLGMNREFDAAAQARADSMRGGGSPGDPMVTIVDPDTGQAYELPQSYLDF